MRKNLFILPVLALASGILAGCGEEPTPAPGPTPSPHTHTYAAEWTTSESQHWHAATCGHDVKGNLGNHVDNTGDGLCDVCNYQMYIPEPDDYKLAPEEFLNLRRATKLEDNKSYYLAVCKKNEGDKMMFMNGEPHKDAKGTYPYYLSETEVTEESDLADVAKVTVEYLDGSDKYFSLHIEKAGATNDDKYVGIYKATSSYDNYVTSIHCGSEIGEPFIDEKDGNKEKECKYNFEWLDEYEGYYIKTAVIMIQDDRLEEDEPSPRFLGTGGEFVSIDCSNAVKALDDTYNLAYFYEVAE